MEVCSNGMLKDQAYVYNEKPPIFTIEGENKRIVKGRGFEITLEEGLDMNSIEQLFSALREGKVGNHTVYINGYLMMYVPAYGFGSFRVIRSSGEVKEELNSLTRKLFSGEIDDLTYDTELYKTGISIEGHTVALFEEASIEAGDVSWEDVIKASKTEIIVESVECKETGLKVDFDKGYIDANPLMIPIMRRADNVKLSAYITVADVIKGRFMGNIVTKKGVISVYKNFSIEEIKKGRFARTRICGKLRLDSERPCFYSNNLSAYSEDQNELEEAMKTLRNLIDTGKSVNF
jgi:hypothetical protein